MAMDHNHIQVGALSSGTKMATLPMPILDQGARPTNLRCPFLAYPTQLPVQPGKATTTLTILWRIMKVAHEVREHQMHPIS